MQVLFLYSWNATLEGEGGGDANTSCCLGLIGSSRRTVNDRGSAAAGIHGLEDDPGYCPGDGVINTIREPCPISTKRMGPTCVLLERCK